MFIPSAPLTASPQIQAQKVLAAAPVARTALPAAAATTAQPALGERDTVQVKAPLKGSAPASLAFFSAPELKTTTLVPGSAHHVEDGAITCSTLVHIDASPQQIVEALKQDWSTWWPNSQTKNLHPTSEGGIQFDLTPLAIAGQGAIHVNIQTHPLEKIGGEVNATKWEIPVTLNGDFKGHAKFEIYAAPDGGTYLRSAWENVHAQGFKAVGIMPEVVTRLHLLVEGHGLEGLKQHLEK